MSIACRMLLGVFFVFITASSYADFCQKLTIEPYKAEEQGKDYKISMALPRFSSSQASCQYSGLNQAVDKLDKTIRKSYLGALPSDSSKGMNSLTVHYDVLNNQDGVVSFKLVEELYYVGQAHPVIYIKTMNFDINRNQTLSLQDLFTDKNYLNPLAKYAKQSLDKQILKGELDTQTQRAWIQNGTTALLDNYANWCLSPKGLLLIFSPYQVAPRQYGTPTVLVPYEKLKAFEYPKSTSNAAE